jgi:plasmid maintenance system antidote protein VapI
MRKTRFGTEIGRRVTEMVAHAGTTQAGLASALGLSRSHLNHMLTGRKVAAPDLEERAARALDNGGKKHGGA